MKMHTKHPRGSVLVFSLLVLFMLLSAALSAAAIVIAGKNSARSTENSALAFQIADGASENVLKRIYKDNDDTLDDLANRLFGPGIGADNPQCSGGVITGKIPSSAGTYEVTFFDNSNNKLQCSGTDYDSYLLWRTKLVYIKSLGSYVGVIRAIEVVVKPL